MTNYELLETDLFDKIKKLTEGYDEGVIHVYKTKKGEIDVQWQFDRHSMDWEDEDETPSENMSRIITTIQLDGDEFTDDQIIDIIENEVMEFI